MVVSNRLGEVKGSSIVKVDPRDRKPAFIKDLIDTKVIEGYPIRLDVKFVGHPEPKLVWAIEGKEVSPQNAHYKLSQSPDGRASLIVEKAKPEGANYIYKNISSLIY